MTTTHDPVREALKSAFEQGYRSACYWYTSDSQRADKDIGLPAYEADMRARLASSPAVAAEAGEVGRISLNEAMLVTLFTSLVAGAYIAPASPAKVDFKGAEELVLECLEQVKRF